MDKDKPTDLLERKNKGVSGGFKKSLEVNKPRSDCKECGGEPENYECITCGMKDCPHGEPLHYHHDGCPACSPHPQDCKCKKCCAVGPITHMGVTPT